VPRCVKVGRAPKPCASQQTSRTRWKRPPIESCSVGFGRLGMHIRMTIAMATGMHRIVKYLLHIINAVCNICV
jgi:hypothetical protein